jgi:Ca2+:H+ antiporter
MSDFTVLPALAGTARDLFAAVVFAHQDKMDIVSGMRIGSAIQIILVVAPVLVPVVGLSATRRTSPSPARSILLRSPPRRSSVRLTRSEGLLLVGIHVPFALAYYFAGAA